MPSEFNAALYDIVMSLSHAMDYISPAMVNHHKRVAQIAFSIGQEIGLTEAELNELTLAGLLHDAGALSLRERTDMLDFETVNPHRHAELGFRLLTAFRPFRNAASMIRYHHAPWKGNDDLPWAGESIPLGSRILFLADRVSVLIKPDQEILEQTPAILDKIKQRSGDLFDPDIVRAFEALYLKESFWLYAVSPLLSGVLKRPFGMSSIRLGLGEVIDLAEVFSHIIDFRCTFTATHTSGVKAVSEALARLAGLPEEKISMMKIAGWLHDLGKLAVPTEILVKKERLSRQDVFTIRKHTFYTYHILENIPELREINAWASFHHERIDGRGYPFRIGGDELSREARIIAVADVFTAVTEDRPYRAGMSQDKAIGVLESMSRDSALDKDIVKLLKAHFDEVDAIRRAAQEDALRGYDEFGR